MNIKELLKHPEYYDSPILQREAKREVNKWRGDWDGVDFIRFLTKKIDQKEKTENELLSIFWKSIIKAGEVVDRKMEIYDDDANEERNCRGNTLDFNCWQNYHYQEWKKYQNKRTVSTITYYFFS